MEAERESFGARRGDHPDGHYCSEDHPVVVARHSLQQACSVPVERPAREGRRLDRGAGRGHRPAHAPAKPQRPSGARCRGRRDRHVRGPGRRTALPGARSISSNRSVSPRPRRCPASCAIPASTFPPRKLVAENVQRAPLHPLDQFRAFQALREKGQSEEDIAAAFFVGVNVVKQRLRLAAVSEKLLDIYAEDGMSLDQLMAFTVTNDHARQEQVWETLQRSYSQEPYQIRRMLTERTVRASDKRALFVGLDAYEQAGGIVMRDLFQQDDGGWLENVGLLDGLVAEKLKAEAETDRRRGLEVDRGERRFPVRPHPSSARARRHADRPHRRGTGDDRCLERRVRQARSRIRERRRTARRGRRAPRRNRDGARRFRGSAGQLRSGRDRPRRRLRQHRCGRRPFRRSRLCPSRRRGAGCRGRRRRSGGRCRSARRRRTILARGPARRHHHRRPDRAGGGRGRCRQAAARSARQRADGVSDARAAGCRGRTIRMSQ